MTAHTAPFLLPLCAAFIYVVSALLIKRASGFGLGVWRTTFAANFIVAAVNSPLWLFGGSFHADRLWQPAVIGALLVAGQSLQFYAIERGDVSVAVPVFGIKVVLVAFFTTLLLAEAVGAKLWIAAVLSVMALTCLNQRDAAQPSRHVGITLISGGCGSLCFALFDVLVQKWTPAWGIGRMLPLIFLFGALLSFVLVPFFRAPLRDIPRNVWPWLGPGAMLLGMQSALFIGGIAIYQHATRANIIYSMRGLFSVLAVWFIGHWFANSERHAGNMVMRWRLVGALLMLLAITLVIE
ncbi:MAG: DMT family transporter [Verrucomicrobia bacterium]|nr:DMT family transporter [Verrucomicrobiota bacterium]